MGAYDIIPISEYDLDVERFSERLANSLENEGVAEISGINQKRLGKLYREVGKIFDSSLKYKFDFGEFQGYNYESEAPRETFDFPGEMDIDRETLEENGLSISGEEWPTDKYFPGLRPIISEVYAELDNIGRKIRAWSEVYSGMEFGINQMDSLGVVGYSSGSKVEAHKDDRVLATLVTRSTHPGLEGKINGRWVPLRAHEGNVIVIPSEFESKKRDKRICALEHRVSVPERIKGRRYVGLFEIKDPYTIF